MDNPDRWLRIALLDAPERKHHYESIVEQLKAEYLSVQGDKAESILAREPDLAILSSESDPQVARLIPPLQRAGVPVLFIADGILEWRNTWVNPISLDYEYGSGLLMPVLSDKICCIGPSHKRWLEYWGNQGKCELTGMPRLDAIADTLAEKRSQMLAQIETPFRT